MEAGTLTSRVQEQKKCAPKQNRSKRIFYRWHHTLNKSI